MTALDIFLTTISVFTTGWGIFEHLKNRDFRSKAEVWLREVQGISNSCSVLRSDCEQGKVGSVRDAGGRVDTIGSSAYSLFTSIQDALKLRD